MSRTVKCVFVHGWGMNGSVWQSCVELLPNWVEAKVIDLPGHGLNAQSVKTRDSMSVNQVYDFDSLVKSVADSVSDSVVEPVIWVGWSLGGLVSMRIAELYPEKVSGLCLVSSNPCFVKKTGWQLAIDKNVFDGFASALSMDIKKTIGRFLALQVAGTGTSKATLKKLRDTLETNGLATQEALELGLDVLSTVDLRLSLKKLNIPVQWFFGDRDKLVPVDIVNSIQSLSPTSEISVIKGAAHAPFLSHTDEFLSVLTGFFARFK